MAEFFVKLDSLYVYLPGGYIVPTLCVSISFLYGITYYLSSFKYMYYHYIEHGTIFATSDGHRIDIQEIGKKYKLKKIFGVYEPVGYVGGFAMIGLCTFLGVIIGSLWPVALFIGVLALPNFAIRIIAKEKRQKAIFEQKLKG